MGCEDLAVLHCNSGYPAAFSEANLKTIPVIEKLFDIVPGLSDHTLFEDADNYKNPLAHVAPVEAIKFGAKIIELHLMMDRDHARKLFEKNEGGFDWPFSKNPEELKKMIEMIRHYEETENISYETDIEREVAEKTHGEVCFNPTEKELKSRNVRPSLWVVEDIKAGEIFQFAAKTRVGNFDSIRPAGGLHIRYTDIVERSIAAQDIQAGVPLAWDMIKVPSFV